MEVCECVYAFGRRAQEQRECGVNGDAIFMCSATCVRGACVAAAVLLLRVFCASESDVPGV